jgi:hypothetical protein
VSRRADKGKRSRGAARATLVAGSFAVALLGCRAILGIEPLGFDGGEPDTSAAEAAADGPAADGPAPDVVTEGSAVPGCFLVHDCSKSRAPGTCAALPPIAGLTAAMTTFHLDACAITQDAGTVVTTLTVGAHTLSGEGTFCGNSFLANGPAIMIEQGQSGLAVDNPQNGFLFDQNDFAVLAVALYRDEGPVNQLLFGSEQVVPPYLGPAFHTRFAYATDGWDGVDQPGLEAEARGSIGAQVRFGVAPSATGLAALAVLPSTRHDCGPHVFRMMRAGTSLTFHVDGNLAGEQTLPAGIDLGRGGNTRLGAAPGGGQRFHGPIGEVFVLRGTGYTSDVAKNVESALKTRWKIP